MLEKCCVFRRSESVRRFRLKNGIEIDFVSAIVKMQQRSMKNHPVFKVCNINEWFFAFRRITTTVELNEKFETEEKKKKKKKNAQFEKMKNRMNCLFYFFIPPLASRSFFLLTELWLYNLQVNKLLYLRAQYSSAKWVQLYEHKMEWETRIKKREAEWERQRKKTR